jgi:hypothetical protein
MHPHAVRAAGEPPPSKAEESDLLICIKLVTALLIGRGGPLLRGWEPPANDPPRRASGPTGGVRK